MRRKSLVVLLLGVLAIACATEEAARYTRDGVHYGVTRGVFRGRWWSYYERGSSFLAGQYYDEAVRDFEQALKGRADDSWRARTYGLHFVEYFPNRELGVAYYHLDRLDDAEKQLTRSLDQMDTERGHYYLDQVKKKKIAAGTLKDEQEPQVGFVVPEATVLAVRELPLEIKAQDDTGVAEIKVNGQALNQRGSAKKVDKKEEIVLDEGKHEIKVEAKDLADKTVTKKVEVTVDLTGPTMGIFSPIEPTVTEDGTVLLEGAAVDKNGVVSVTLGERMLAESKGAPKLDFRSDLPLADGENSFVLASRDIAGNETRSAVKVFKGNPNSPQARLWLYRQKHPEGMQVAMADGVALDLLLTADPAPADEIRLKSPNPDKPYRHNRTLTISGEVVAKTKVASLAINGQPFTELTGAPKESFNRRIPIDASQLKDGTGKIPVEIVAQEDGGETLEKKFSVDVRPVELASKESRMPVAVLAFAGQGVDAPVSELLRVNTEGQMLTQNRFRVLDRTRLQDVLNEQQLGAALADPNQAITLGKLTNAQIFIVADVFPRDQKGLEIKARAISAETSDVLATLDGFIEDKDNRDGVVKACQGIGDQLAKLFPRLSGEILSVRDTEMLLNWTQDDGVHEGAYVLILKEEAPWVDQTTGEVLAPGEMVEVGRAKIQSVLKGGCKAKTVETKQEGAKLETGMPAITM